MKPLARALSVCFFLSLGAVMLPASPALGGSCEDGCDGVKTACITACLSNDQCITGCKTVADTCKSKCPHP